MRRLTLYVSKVAALVVGGACACMVGVSTLACRPPAPSAIATGLPIGPWRAQWRPPELRVGKLSELRRALASAETFRIVVEQRSGPLTAAALATELERLAPNAKQTHAAADVTVHVSRGGPTADSHVRGSCEPLVDELARDYERSLVSLDRFFARTQGQLQRTFTARLREVQPASAALRALQAACTQTCQWTPRVVLNDGVAIVAPAVDQFVELPQTSRETIERIQRATVDAVLPRLSQQQSVRADRGAVVAQMREALRELCVPARRRFAREDRFWLQTRVRTIGRWLASSIAADEGRWRATYREVGRVVELARVARAEHGWTARARDEVRKLRVMGRMRVRCMPPPNEWPPVKVTLTDSSGTIRWQQVVYPEMLVCNDLGVADGAR